MKIILTGELYWYEKLFLLGVGDNGQTQERVSLSLFSVTGNRLLKFKYVKHINFMCLTYIILYLFLYMYMYTIKLLDLHGVGDFCHCLFI